MAVMLVFSGAIGVHAKVFASQNAALAEAFPDATRIDRNTRIVRKTDLAKTQSTSHGNRPLMIPTSS